MEMDAGNTKIRQGDVEESFLLSRFRILQNTANLKDSFYNRVTLTHNPLIFVKSHCWIHEAVTDIRDFSESISCSCGSEYSLTSSITCPQDIYVRTQLSSIWDFYETETKDSYEAEIKDSEETKDDDKVVLVDFGSSRCLAAVYKDGVYLFSSLGCGHHNQSSAIDSIINVKAANEISCENCRAMSFSGTDTGSMVDKKFAVATMKQEEIAKYNERDSCGLTLLEHFPIAEYGDIYAALRSAQDCARSLAILEGIIPLQNTALGELQGKVDNVILENLMEMKNNEAERLVEKCKLELISLCSNLVGQVNSYCQAPLKVYMRWLRHWMCLEYLVEFSADLSNCFYDEFSGKYVPNLRKENVVLHEFVQCSVISSDTIENIFRLCLQRLDEYLGVRKVINCKSIGFDVATRTETDGFVCPAKSEVSPYWWNFYSQSNTLGESDSLASNGNSNNVGSSDSLGNGVTKRLTRSQLSKLQTDEPHTPLARKKGRVHTQSNDEDPMALTHCISSNSLRGAFNEDKYGGAGARVEDDDESIRTDEHICYCGKCIGSMCCVGRHFEAKDFRDTTSMIISAVFGDMVTNTSINSKENEIGGFKTLLSLKRSIKVAVEAGAALCRSIRAHFKSYNLGNIQKDFGDIQDLGNIQKDFGDIQDLGNIQKDFGDVQKDLGNAQKDFGENSLECGLKQLNTALLSALRLGDVLFNSCNMDDHVDEIVVDGVAVDCDDHPLQQQSSNIGDLLFHDSYIGKDTLDSGAREDCRNTFENDLYITEEIVSYTEDPSPESSLSTSPKPKLSTKLIGRRKRASVSPTMAPRTKPTTMSRNNEQSSENSQQLQRSARRHNREPWKSYANNDFYIYDTNNLSDKAEIGSDYGMAEDWYNEDSDASSKKSLRLSQKKMPTTRPSSTNLTEIYGNQDMLIPMGPLPIGVYFDASRKLWRCQWRENGKFRTKGFSLGHYNSLSDARHACIIFRCQVGNIPVQPEWLTPNYIQVSELLNKRSNTQQNVNSTPKKSKRRRKRSLEGLESTGQTVNVNEIIDNRIIYS